MDNKLRLLTQKIVWWIALVILIPITFIECYLGIVMAGGLIFLGLVAFLVYILYFVSGFIFPWSYSLPRITIGIVLIIVATGLMLYGVKSELIRSWSGSLDPSSYFFMASGILFGFLAGLIIRTYRFLLSRIGILGKYGFNADG